MQRSFALFRHYVLSHGNWKHIPSYIHPSSTLPFSQYSPTENAHLDSLFSHVNNFGKNLTSGQKLCSTQRETCCSLMACKMQEVSPRSLTLNWGHWDAINPLTLLSLFAFNSLTNYTAEEQLFYSTGFFVWLVSLINLQNQICLQLFKLSPVSLSEYFPYAMTNLFTSHFILKISVLVTDRGLKECKNIKKRKSRSCNITILRTLKPEISIINTYERRSAQYALWCKCGNTYFETVARNNSPWWGFPLYYQ